MRSVHVGRPRIDRVAPTRLLELEEEHVLRRLSRTATLAVDFREGSWSGEAVDVDEVRVWPSLFRSQGSAVADVRNGCVMCKPPAGSLDQSGTSAWRISSGKFNNEASH